MKNKHNITGGTGQCRTLALKSGSQHTAQMRWGELCTGTHKVRRGFSADSNESYCCNTANNKTVSSSLTSAAAAAALATSDAPWFSFCGRCCCLSPSQSACLSCRARPRGPAAAEILHHFWPGIELRGHPAPHPTPPTLPCSR